MSESVDFSPELLERLAQRLTELTVSGSAAAVRGPWMTAEEAASYLRCPVSRIRKLTMLGELLCHRDGRRVLYHRADLDKFVLAGGAYAS